MALNWYLLAALDEGVGLLAEGMEAPIAHDSDVRLPLGPRVPHDFSGMLADVERHVREAIKVLPPPVREAAFAFARSKRAGHRSSGSPPHRARIAAALRQHLETGGDQSVRACREAVRQAGLFARNGLIDEVRRGLLPSVPAGRVRTAS